METEVLIVGAGPAGIAAACAAGSAGRRVLLLDDNRQPGGQIWRDELPEPWPQRLRASNAEFLWETRMLAPLERGRALAERAGGPLEIRYEHVILAAGARERFLPFPGWTLPNVLGAGGLQALVKAGLPVKGRRVVVAGSGPLLLAAAALLRSHGARIEAVAEQAPWGRLARFGLAAGAARLAQAARLRWALRGVPYLASTWPVAAEGKDKLEAVRLSNGTFYACDYLGCGFGLVPNLELPILFGCRIERGFVAVNDWCETSQPGVFCAGEPTGIGGLERSLAQGRIAGYAAAGRKTAARHDGDRFRRSLEQAFQLRDELQRLATSDTIVCRCEDVPLGRIAGHRSAREAKLQTRCGMGPCQGRICGPALEFLLGWERDSVRPPALPATMRTLAGIEEPT